MKTYSIVYRHSRDGKMWTVCTTSVKANTESEAIAKLHSKHPYVKDVRIQSVR